MFNLFAQTGTILVKVTGINNDIGVIKFGLFDNGDAFPDIGKEIIGGKVVAKTTGVSFTFNNVKPGTYAVAAIHDENKNDKLEKNIFGVPTEQYGFSRNVYGKFGPPDFDKVSFQLRPGKKVTITINYK